MAKLEAEKISMVFHSRGRDVEALRQISVTVESGEFVSIVGPSGCGKTTLLRIVAGVVQPESGRVLLDGHPVTKPGRERAMVFQQDSLLPWRTVMDNVTLGLQIAGRSKEERIEIGQSFIDLVGLTGFENSFPHELSGGMRQRANLSRALAVDPDILLMDEPFASLDAQTRELMQSELLKIWERSNKTVLFITHQIDEAIYLSDRVVVMSGRPGTVREVVNIDIPRPRALDVKRSTGFVGYVDRIWKLLEDDIRRGLIQSLDTVDADR